MKKIGTEHFKGWSLVVNIDRVTRLMGFSDSRMCGLLLGH